MKTILAPIDFSEATSLVCKVAGTLAKAVNARVILLHCVTPPIITTEQAPMMENLAEITEAAEKAATKQLTRLQARLQRQFVVAEVAQATGGPVDHILTQAADLHADYIVLGSHGHTALYELVLGSTTHGVLMKASCPVVIVPPPRARAKKSAKKK